MQRRTSALTAAALALLPLGQPLLLSTLGIATATTAVVLHQGAAIAQDSSAVAKIAKAITVRIEGATQGSGVIVKRDGNRYTVLTAWHVIKSNKQGEEVSIFTDDGISHTIEANDNIKRLGKLDLAEVRFNSKNKYKIAARYTADKIETGSEIVASGYPLNDNQYNAKKGLIVAHAEIGIDQGYELLYSSNTSKGMSGGPLVNSNGLLIGIHGRGEVNQTKIDQSKTGINQGIPISYYQNFLKNGSITQKETIPRKFDDYFALAQNSRRINQPQTTLRMTEQMKKIEPFKIEIYSMERAAYIDLGQENNAKKSMDLFSKYFKAYRQKIGAILGSFEMNRREQLMAIKEAEKYTSLPVIEIDYLKATSYGQYGTGDFKKSLKYANLGIQKINDGHCSFSMACDEERIKTFFLPSFYTLAGIAKSNLNDINGALISLEIATSMLKDKEMKGLAQRTLAEIYLKSENPSFTKTCKILTKKEAMEVKVKSRNLVSSVMDLCLDKSLSEFFKKAMFNIATIKPPTEYRKSFPPISKTPPKSLLANIPNPVLAEMFQRGANKGHKDNQYFDTLTIIYDEPVTYSRRSQAEALYEDPNKPNRLMIYKPSIGKFGNWIIVQTVFGDMQYGNRKLLPDELDTVRIVNCKTNETSYVWDIDIKKFGKEQAIINTINRDQHVSKRTNGWWMEDYQVNSFFKTPDNPLYPSIQSHHNYQSLFDYVCK